MNRNLVAVGSSMTISKNITNSKTNETNSKTQDKSNVY